MTTSLIAFFVSFLCSLAGTGAAVRLGHHLGVVDRPDGIRKIHLEEMSLLGGLAILISFALPVALLLTWFQHLLPAKELVQNSRELVGIALGALIIFSVGLVDDLKDLRPKYKLIGQFLAAALAIHWGVSIDSISLPVVGTFDLGWLGYPLTLFWFLGCMNALNMMDGLDGLAAGIALLVSITIFVVSLVYGNVLVMILSSVLSGAVLGFLFFNFHPARIFLGDSGAMLLGFMISALAILGARQTETTVSLFIPILALGLPILDSLLVILRRLYRRLPIGNADKRHLHHLLMSKGWGQTKAVLVLYGLCILFGASALLVTFDPERFLLVLGAMTIILFVSLKIVGGLRLRRALSNLHQQWDALRTDNRLRAQSDQQRYRLESSRTTEEMWSEAVQLMQLSGAHYISLELDWGDGKEHLEEGQVIEYKAHYDLYTVCLPLRLPAPLSAVLRVHFLSHNTDLPSPITELMRENRLVLERQLGRMLKSRTPDLR